MKNNTRIPSPISTATTSPGDRYLFRIRRASLISFRSGPVNGVTRFNSKNPFTHPRRNQKHPTIVLARILCLNRYTTRLVVKIKNALYKKIRGLPVIYCQASQREWRESASITRYSTQHPRNCRGTDNKLQIRITWLRVGFFRFIFFMFFLLLSAA